MTSDLHAAPEGLLPDPVAALATGPADQVMALITGVEGPSYRPVGAVMALAPGNDPARTGTLSSGCVEGDITLHAERALQDGTPRRLRYGRGSPFVDIQLPCGGGLDILLVPRPDRAVLAEVAAARAARRPVTLSVDAATGALAQGSAPTGWQDDRFHLRMAPELRFLTFGKGPEASTFATLTQAAGYPTVLLSPDTETLAAGTRSGCGTRHLTHAHLPGDVPVDPWTAILLFFHDHDWEPPILGAALASPAFYIGAQGSRRARDLRLLEMESTGIPRADLARLHGPVGLIPSARDARTLAVSVLAEVLDRARALPA